MTNVRVVMANALIDVIVFQNVQPCISFTMLQTIQRSPKHCQSIFCKSSPVIIVFKNAFKAPNMGKSLMIMALSAPGRRKHLELLDLLPSVNTFSQCTHTRTMINSRNSAQTVIKDRFLPPSRKVQVKAPSFCKLQKHILR